VKFIDKILRRPIYTGLLLAIILATGLIFRLVLLGQMNLFVDEAYYWDWSRNLSFGYFSHPPMVAWLILLGRLLFSDTEIGIRIPFVVLGLGTIFMAYILGKTFFDKSAGLLLALFVSLSPSYLLTSRMALPDQPVIFFWIMSLIFFWRAYKDLRFRDWILLGIFLGLGFLSKYQMFFLPLAIFAFLVFSQKGRRILKTFQPYIGFGIAMLVFLPNILWNAGHHWITFIFQSVYGVERSFSQSFTLGNILENFLIFSKELLAVPDIVLKLAALLSLPLFFWFGVKQKREEFVFLFASFIFITSFFSIFFGNSHWFFPGAIGACLMFVAWIVSLCGNRLIMVSISGLILIFLYINAFASWNLITSLALGKELHPDFAKIRVYNMVFGDSHSWKETVKKVSEAINYRPGEMVLIAQIYTIASELAFYLPDHPRVYSPNGQYLIWGPPEVKAENNIEFVVYNPNLADLSLNNTKLVKIDNSSHILYAISLSKADWEKLGFDWTLKLKGP